MGFRSVGITEHTGVTIPEWFRDKWKDELNIPEYEGDMVLAEYVGKPRTPISYKWERKSHLDIIEDLQKVVAEDKEWSGEYLGMIIYHENREVTKLKIFADKVQYFVAHEWEEVEDIYYYY